MKCRSLALAVAVILGSGCAPVRPVSNVHAIIRVADVLAANVDRDAPGNVVVAPPAAVELLAILDAGAAGGTRAQLNRVLFFDAASQESLASIGPEMQSLRDLVSLRNALAMYKSFGWDPKFVSSVSSIFDTQTPNVSLGKAGSTQIVRAWIAESLGSTRPFTIPADTKLLAIATASYTTAWAYPFEKDETMDLPFYSMGKRYTVPTMYQQIFAGYGEDHDVTYAVIALQNGFSMLLTLPRLKDARPSLKHAVALSQRRLFVNGHDVTFGGRNVNLTLPRFSLTHTLDLAQQLAKPGFKVDFSSSADFSPMFTSSVEPGRTAVYQMTKLTVNEGSGGAVGPRKVGLGRSWRFLVDHPFAVVIFRDRDRAVLFAGTVYRP